MRFITFLWALVLGAAPHPHVVLTQLDFDSALILVETLEYGEDEEVLPGPKREWTITVPQEKMVHETQVRRFDDPEESKKVLGHIRDLRVVLETWTGTTVKSVRAKFDPKKEDWSFTFMVWKDGKWVEDSWERADVPQEIQHSLAGWLRYAGESVLWWLNGDGVPLPSPQVAYAPDLALAF